MTFSSSRGKGGGGGGTMAIDYGAKRFDFSLYSDDGNVQVGKFGSSNSSSSSGGGGR